MKRANPGILTINGGSLSIKFALYQVEAPLQRMLYGKVDESTTVKNKNWGIAWIK